MVELQTAVALVEVASTETMQIEGYATRNGKEAFANVVLHQIVMDQIGKRDEELSLANLSPGSLTMTRSSWKVI